MDMLSSDYTPIQNESRHPFSEDWFFLPNKEDFPALTVCARLCMTNHFLFVALPPADSCRTKMETAYYKKSESEREGRKVSTFMKWTACPIGPFTILKPQDQEIGEIYVVVAKEHRSTDCEAPKVVKGSVGSLKEREPVWKKHKNTSALKIWKLRETLFWYGGRICNG